MGWPTNRDAGVRLILVSAASRRAASASADATRRARILGNGRDQPAGAAPAPRHSQGAPEPDDDALPPLV